MPRRALIAFCLFASCTTATIDTGSGTSGTSGSGGPGGGAAAGTSGSAGAAGTSAAPAGTSGSAGAAGAAGAAAGTSGNGGTGGGPAGGTGGAAGGRGGTSAAGTTGASGRGGGTGAAGTTGAGGRGGGTGAAGTTGASGRGGGTGAAGTTGTGGGTAGSGCPVELIGWAAVNADGVATTTGGGSAAPTTVTSFADLKAAAQDSKPRVIIVSGTIKTTDGGGSAMNVAANKTIVGANKNATIYGGINMSGVSNVISRNLNIQGTWPNSGPDDTVASHNSHHIWYDHLNIWDSTDGSLDITNQSNHQTVSWTKFWYSSTDHPHRLASLNGSGGGDHPEDWNYLKVTYHHNWWADKVNERMPRVMYGQGHQFNNYFTATGNLYCIGVGSYGAILVENNYFKNVNAPHQFMYDIYMEITARGNVYDNTTGAKDNGRGGTRDVSTGGFPVQPFTTPPYDYKLDDAKDVPAVVQRCAGPQ